MKKQTKKVKLTLRKFTISKLNEASKIRGGTGVDTNGETVKESNGIFCIPKE